MNNNYNFAISLGSECFTNTPFIKKFYPSFPLNNVKSFDFKKVIYFLDGHINDITNKKYLISKYDNYGKNIIYNKKLNIYFYHENPLNTLKDIIDYKKY